MSSADDFKNQGNNAFKNKDYDTAIELYTKAIELDPKKEVYYSNRSGAFAAANKLEEALQDAEECLKVNPGFAKGYSRKGYALEVLGREEEAAEAYDAGLKVDPNNKELQDKKAAISERPDQSMGDLMGLLNNPDIKKMMQENPQMLQTLLQNPGLFKDPSMMANMAKMFSGKGKAPEGASPHSPSQGHKEERKPAEGNPWDQPHHQEPHSHHKEEPMPTRRPEPSKPSQTPWDTAKAQGDAEYKKRSFEAAINHYEEAIKLQPTQLLAYNNKAACLIELKRLDDALKTTDEAIEKYKETEQKERNYQHYAKVLARKARILQLQNKLADAQKWYESSLMEDRVPAVEEGLREVKRAMKKAEEQSYLDPVLSEKHREAGNEFFQKGDFGKAIQEYEEAKKRNPTDPKVYNNIASCFSKIMKYNEAMKEVERALELDPKFIKAMIRKGNLHNMLKEHHKALDAFNKVLALEPENQEAKVGLEQTQMKISMSMSEGNDEERMKRAMNDPEIVSIMQDPMVRIALEQMQANPRNIMEYMNDSTLGPKINKLIAAGIIKARN
jgi:stress-induced-phosphoprotein 1